MELAVLVFPREMEDGLKISLLVTAFNSAQAGTALQGMMDG